MKLAVGYQLGEEGDEPFAGIVRDYREAIAEVYFPWPGAPSGRAALGRRRGFADWSAQERLERDLAAFRQMGLALDLLLNANCYGARAVSESLENEVCSILERLDEVAGGADVVTTASLAVARTVKREFPRVEVRASVNMRIGTIEAMRYVSGLFDSFHIQRDVQRDIAHVREVRQWCEANGKRLSMLANSGCLRLCPGQVFHDNMVAHDAEIDETRNISGWTPHVCWNLYRERVNWPAVLQSTWVRPEDLRHYEGLVDVVKLATRMHERPRMVIHAYATGEHAGNLLDLLEPGFSPAFAPWAVDNTRFPSDWFERTSACGWQCHKCSYCAEVLERVLVRAGEEGA
jgi:collagenase-like PrtC family protease